MIRGRGDLLDALEAIGQAGGEVSCAISLKDRAHTNHEAITKQKWSKVSDFLFL
jgi:hypothetical protein